MNIEKLIWDSEFFGLKIGRVIIIDENDFHPEELKSKAIDEKFELVYVLKHSKMLSWSKVYNANLELVDIMLTMSKRFDKKDFLNTPFYLYNVLSDNELKDCYNISEKTSIVSRFYNEPKVGPFKTKQLYRKWIDNSLNNTFADGLFIEKTDNSVTGIHLIKTDHTNKTGYFTLTGVNPNLKGKGIGKSLWLQSFAYWANKSEIEIVKSSFSFQNQDSFNFHIRMGFQNIDETKFIYHFRNNSF